MIQKGLWPLALLLVAGVALADTPEQRGLEIAQEVDRRDSGFQDYVVEGLMTLHSPDGTQGTRRFEMSTLEVTGDGDKRLVVFSEPRDLAGFVSLTYAHGTEPDDQWIYMPALHRTKRLVARDKTGAFAGSEFSFEDIATWELDKYRYRFLGDEPCGEPVQEKICHVIENIPNYEYSGYSRLVEWIDPAVWHPLKIVYYDQADRPLKELRFFDYQQYQGRYWRPDRIEMHNLQSGAVSEIQWRNYRFATGLDEADLSPNSLPRWSR